MTVAVVKTPNKSAYVGLPIVWLSTILTFAYVYIIHKMAKRSVTVVSTAVHYKARRVKSPKTV